VNSDLSKNFDNNPGAEWLSLSKLSIGSPYSAEYLSLLARRRKLPARKVDNIWYSTSEAVNEYVRSMGLKNAADTEKDQLLPLSRLASDTPYSAEYLSLLARKHKFQARKIDGIWCATKSEVADYVKKQGARAFPIQATVAEKVILQTLVGREEKVLLKQLEIPGKPIKSYRSYTDIANEAFAFVEKVPSTLLFNKVLATSLSLIAVMVLGSSLYAGVSGRSLSSDLGNRVSIAASYVPVAASVGSSIDAFLDGFRSMRDMAFATLFQREVAAELPSYKPGDTALAQEKSAPIVQTALKETAPTYSLSALRSDLKTELESYIRAQLSAVSPVNIYQSGPSYNNTFRTEILTSDTRPTVTRQSSSDVSELASLVSRLATDGTLTNPTITGGSISGAMGNFIAVTFGSATGTAATTTDFYSTNAMFENIVGSNLDLSNLVFGSATGTNATTTNFYAATGRFGNLFGSAGELGTIFASGSTTLQNLTFQNATGSSATTTNFFSNIARVGYLESDDFIGLNATTTNLYSTTASSTNLYSANGRIGTLNADSLTVGAFNSGSASLSNLFVSGSTTLQNLTFQNATGTNATNTNFFSAKGAFDELYVNDYQQNDGTFVINSTVATGDIFSVNDAAITSGTLIHQVLTANAGNGQTSKGQVIDLIDSTVAGGGYSALTINTSGSGVGSGEKTLLALNPGGTNGVVFDSMGAFRPTTDASVNTNTIGSASYYWKNGYFDTLTANNLSGTVVTGATSNDTWTVGSTEAGDDLKALIFQRNSGSGNATFQWNSGVSDLRYLSVNYPFNSTYTVTDASIGTSVNLYSGSLTNNTTGGTQKLLSLTNTGTGTTETGIYLNNTGTGSTAFEIAGNWTNGILVGSGSTTLQNFTAQNSTTSNSTTTNLYVSGRASTTELRANTAYFGSFVGIGTTNPSSTLQIGTSGDTKTAVVYGNLTVANTSGLGTLLGDDATGGYLQINNSQSFGIRSGVGGATRAIFMQDGTVGIGTTTPFERLSVAGNAYIGGNLTATGTLTVLGNFLLSGSTTLQNFTAINSTTTNATTTNSYFSNSLTGPGNFVVNSSGSVGVGISSPLKKFSVLQNSTTINLDPAASGPRVSFGSNTVANEYMEIGAYNSTNNIDNKGRGLVITGGNATLTYNSGGSGAGTIFTVQDTNTTNNSFGTMKFRAGTDSDGGQITASKAELLSYGLVNGLTLRTSSSTQDIGFSVGLAEFGGASGPSMVIKSSGNVGIGALNPSTKLEVNGGLLITSSTTLQNFTAVNSTTTNATTTNLFVSGLASTTQLRANTGIFGNIGIGTTAVEGRLSVEGSQFMRSGSTLYFRPSGNDYDFDLQAIGSGASSRLAIGSNALSNEAISILTTGNVGIGTSTPGAALHVNKTGSNEVALFTNTGTNPYLTVGTSASAGGFLRWNSANSTIQLGHHTIAGGGGLHVNSSGNVGIGTTNPASPLEVNGVLTVQSVITPSLGTLHIRPAASGSANGQVSFATGGVQTFYTAGGDIQAIFNNGNIGIATTTPFEKLSVAGSAYIGGNLTATGTLTVHGNFLLSGSTTLQNFTAVNSTTTNATTTNSYFSSSLRGPGNFVVNSSGTVGIGTSAPDARHDIAMHVYGSNPTLKLETIAGGGWAYTQYKTPSAYWSTGVDDNDVYMISQGIDINVNPKLSILTSGEVGIGTTNPTSRLMVNSLSQAPYDRTLQLRSNAWNNFFVGHSASAVHFGNNTGALAFHVGSDMGVTGSSLPDNEKMRIDASGNVGIATTTPSYKLSVSGSGFFDGGTIYASSLVATSTITTSAFNTGSLLVTGSTTLQSFSAQYASTTQIGSTGQAYFATSGGNVGIGTTNPNALLDVLGSGNVKIKSAATGAGSIEPGGSKLSIARSSVSTTLNETSGYLHLGGLENAANGYWNIGFGYWDTNFLYPAGYIGFQQTTDQATGDLVFGGAGSERMRINSLGRVGIGTSTPNNKLDVYSTSKSAIGFSGASGDTYKWTIGMDVTNGGRFAISSSTALGTLDRLVIDGNGNVGIGTTNPGGILHVVKSTNGFTNSIFSNTSNGTSAVNRVELGNDASDGIGQLMVYGSQHSTKANYFEILNAANSPLSLGANNAVALTILGSGNVGIGTTNPSAALTVNASDASWRGMFMVRDTDATSTASPYLTFWNGNESGTGSTGLMGRIGIVNANSFHVWSAANYPMAFATNDIERMTILAAGNVGIATTTPSYKLSVSGSGFFDGGTIYASSLVATSSITTSAFNTGSLLVTGSTTLQNFTAVNSTTTNATTTNLFVSGLASTTQLRANTGLFGNVGIGTSTPSVPLHVLGSIEALRLQRAAAGAASVSMTFMGGGTDGLYNWQISKDAITNNNLEFTPSTGTNGSTFTTPALVMTRTGNIGIGTTNPSQKLNIDTGVSSLNQGAPGTSGTTQNGIVRLRPGAATYGETFDMGMNVVSGASYAWLQSTNATNLATNYSLSLNPNGGYVGIGTTAPFNKLDIAGSGATIAGVSSIQFGDNNSASSRNFAWSNGAGGNTTDLIGKLVLSAGSSQGANALSGTALMTVIASSGNVGIGSTNPSSKLVVNGTLGIGADELPIKESNYGYSATYKVLEIGTSFTANRSLSLNINPLSVAGGNFSGIGNILIASSTILAPNAAGTDWIGVLRSTIGKVYLGGSSSGGELNGTGVVVDSTTAKVGIGTTNPTNKLTVSGAADFTGFVGIGTTATIDSSGEILTVYNASTGHTLMQNSSDSVGTLYVKNTSTTASTNQPYITLTDGGGNRGGLGVQYTDSALWLGGQGGIRFRYGGTSNFSSEAMRIDSSGRIGIGTTTPTDLLTLDGSDDKRLSIYRNGVQNVLLGDAGSGNDGTLILYNTVGAPGWTLRASNTATSTLATTGGLTVGTSQFVVQQSSGFVGIGTTTPGTTLDVYTSGNSNGVARFINASANGANSTGLYVQAGADTSANYIANFVNYSGASKLYVRGDGNIGIGTTTPNTELHISKTGETVGMRFSADANQQAELVFNKGGVDKWYMLSAASSNDLRFHDGSAERVTFEAGGFVGIGTTNPARLLSLNSSGASDDIFTSFNQAGTEKFLLGVQNIASQNRFTLYDSVAGQYRLTVDTSGNVGIGTTVPTSLLSLYSSSPALTVATSDGADNRSLDLASAGAYGDSRGGGIQLVGNEVATTGGRVDLTAGNISTGHIQFNTGGANTMRITNGGNVGIGTTNPGGRFVVVGAANDVALLGATAGATSNAFINLASSGDSIIKFGMRLDSNDAFNLDYRNSSTGNPATALAITRAAGNVGIGTTTPSVKLDVNGTGLFNSAGSNQVPGGGLRITSSISSSKYSWQIGGNQLVDQAFEITPSTAAGGTTFTTPAFTILGSSGNVGIGTTNPLQKLEVVGNQYLRGTNMDSSVATPVLDVNGGLVRIGDGGSAQSFTNGVGIKFNDTDVNHASIKYTSSSGRLDFCNSGDNSSLTCSSGISPVLSILLPQSSGGSVGIGTTTPRNKFMVEGATSELAQFYNTTAGGGAWSMYVGDNGSTLPANSFGIGPFGSTANSKLVISSAGYVGIGLTNPGYELDVAGGDIRSRAAGQAVLRTWDTATREWAMGVSQIAGGAGKWSLYDATADSHRIAVDTSGNVGIGSTSPMTMFVVSGTSTMQDILPGGTMTNNTSIYSIGSSTSRWNTIWTASLNVGTSTWSMNNGGDGRLSFFNAANGGGTETLSLFSGGNVGIGTTNTSEKLTINGNLAFSGGSKIKDASGKLQLQAGGSGTGSSGTGSIYFLDSSAAVRARLDTVATSTVVGSGDGADGAISLTTAGTTNCQTTAIAAGRSSGDCIATAVSATASSGQAIINVTSITGYAAGDEILVVQMSGTGIGNNEFRTISAVDGGTSTITVTQILSNTYTTGGGSLAQVVRVPNYTSVTIGASGQARTLTVSAWDGAKGGVLAFRATGTVTVVTGSSIDASGKGFSGGSAPSGGGNGSGGAPGGGNGTNGSVGNSGSSGTGLGAGTGGARAGGVGTFGTGAAGAWGGGGGGAGGLGSGGGGGSYGVAGSSGTSASAGGGNGSAGDFGGAGGGGGAGSTAAVGTAGSTYGSASLSSIYLGSGGGSGAGGNGGGGGGGGPDTTGGFGGLGGNGGAGGAGGGILFIEANIVTNGGSIIANGASGSNGNAGGNAGGASTSNSGSGGGGGGSAGTGGGGGSGGSLIVKANTISAGTMTASGGSAGVTGAGGVGGSMALNGANGAGGGGAGNTGGLGGTTNAGGGNGQTGGSGNAAGGAGGAGRIRCDTTAGSGCTTTPSADQNVYVPSSIATVNGYGTFYIGSVSTVSADLAEYYVTGDRNLAAGDLVCLSNMRILEEDSGEEIVNQGVLRKCKGANDPALMGVISTSPGVALGSIDSETHKEDNRVVALAGRVPAKVSTENGDVQIGDYLTSSSIPGVAMKATGFVKVIGMAMENFSASATGTDMALPGTASSTTVHVGKVTAFVNLTTNSSGTIELVFDASGRLVFGVSASSTASTAASTTASTTDAFTLSPIFSKIWDGITSRLSGFGVYITEAFTRINNLFAGSLHIEKELCVDDICIDKDQLKALLIQAGGTASSAPTSTGTTTPTVFTPIVVIDSSDNESASSTPAVAEEESDQSVTSTSPLIENTESANEDPVENTEAAPTPEEPPAQSDSSEEVATTETPGEAPAGE
jgi:hypothetical protein